MGPTARIRQGLANTDQLHSQSLEQSSRKPTSSVCGDVSTLMISVKGNV